jgi:hydroxymethylpyrimidine/phosphomethylpyrimidine kinase
VSAKPARILIAAGSDSGGGAGIQADIKTVTALGGYAATAITALTAQNTQGVFGVVGVEPVFIRQQMELVLDDIGADAIKTGMLHDAAVIVVIADVVAKKAAAVPLVVDPVMVAKGGARLIAEDAIGALKSKLIVRATVITPNLPEAEVLVGGRVADVAAMKRAAEALRELGCEAVLLKGGHLEGDVLSDVLASADGIEVFESPRIHSRNTHGTGCTLASAIATGLGQKMSLRDAVIRARAYVRRAIETAPEIGHGHGPLNHGHSIPPYQA